MKFRFIIVVTGVMCLVPLMISGALADPSRSRSADHVNAKITLKAKEWFHRFQTGTIDRSQLNAESNMDLTAELAKQEEARLQPYGRPASFRFLKTERVAGLVAYDFLITFSSVPDVVLEKIAFDGSGKIAGIDFRTYVPTPT